MEALRTHYSGDLHPLTPEELAPFLHRLRTLPAPMLPLEETESMLYELNEFDLGRFLLRNGGINGYWTAYWLIHGPQKALTSPLESWLIHETPAFRASRERFSFFQRELQALLSSGKSFASIPCGLMDDLLRLDYSGTEGIRLTGIDLDADSLHLGRLNAKHIQPQLTAAFLQQDAFSLALTEEFDVITSNGLNFYEPEETKVTTLYKNFFQALKPGGTLLTSFLTPPPTLVADSPWKNVDPAAALKQKVLFMDILNMRWHAFRTEAQTIAQLEEAGFKIDKLIYDSQGIFPTLLAQKPSYPPFQEIET